MQKIKAGIIGGAGYTGGELVRLLLHHPGVDLSFVHSRSNAGKKLSSVHQDLEGDTRLAFSEGYNEKIDVLFLCLGHRESQKFLEANPFPGEVKIIDLSQDFRLKGSNQIGDRNFIYGLPELNKEEIRQAENIANPGCFATAIQLGLLPLAKAGLLKEVHSTGITGSTGAGISPAPSSHFSWRANNIQPYKVLTHQHLHEINGSLEKAGSLSPEINFVPWRGDFTRGIFISSTLDSTLSIEELTSLYIDYFKEAPFTIFSEQTISLKQVVNTNKCMISLERAGNKLVVHSAIDNLLKGASGQAVQNMNLVFGFDEKEGLHLKATAF